ncbi:hypothetical protein AXF42_Ash011315 [Apostasia shenzhenica]|uniref:RecQ mediated genome instability protein 1 OB-fold domain-containing protein n=1 Tax=Apostasia shenzhenica TaxID=1088818 RepID=A0A2I0AEA5_9ASPA|nr:hypothetical protein AXF42_Ash011315 [Apostasia shenzhenica]
MTDSDRILETLISKGWRFRDPSDILSVIRSKTAASTSTSSSTSLSDSIESELLDKDLRSFGGKSIPESSAMKKSSYLHGPIVVQLVSVRDISRSIIDSSFKSSKHGHRLLRLILTDGLSQATAIEYTSIPSIMDEINPGCKVRLENKTAIHYGILCLNSKDVKIMGGVVQALYEEWQMSQKFSGLSRSILQPYQNDDIDGPPPFEKFQSEFCSMKVSQLSSSRDQWEVTSHLKVDSGEHHRDVRNDKVINDHVVVSRTETEENPSRTEARPKEVNESVPVQNQAASQKLLQKMSQPIRGGRYSMGHRTSFKNKQEEVPVFTLDEWERRKATTSKAVGMSSIQDISHDEELARQLQNQLDMEDYQNNGRSAGNEAEQIRMNMFNFDSAEERRREGANEFRGRGKGRSRGRGRKRYG